jgi:hypothetical protein
LKFGIESATNLVRKIDIQSDGSVLIFEAFFNLLSILKHFIKLAKVIADLGRFAQLLLSSAEINLRTVAG